MRRISIDRPARPISARRRDWPDNPERFAALSSMAARIAAEARPDGWTRISAAWP
jgi:glycogen synthase